MQSFYTKVDGLTTDDELHSPVVEAVQFEGTPAYRFSLQRLTGLGLTVQEAEAILKG